MEVAASSTPLKPPPVFCNGEARVVDLAGAGFAAQLSHHFIDLRQPGGANRMAARQQTAGNIDRDFPPSVVAPDSAIGRVTEGAETECFGLLDFGECGGIVDFGQRHVLRTDAGDFIGLIGGQMAKVTFIGVSRALGGAAQHRGADADGAGGLQLEQAGLIADDGCRCAIADRRAHRQRQRP